MPAGGVAQEAPGAAAGRDSPAATVADDGFPLAVTFDDLPWNGPAWSPTETRRLAETLIAALADRGVPATGFVNCDRVATGAPILRRWLAAGLELGNHTASHPDLNATPTDEWLADAWRCGEALAALTGERPRFFRYPMLHQGASAEVRDSVAGALEARGYRNAHVTVDNSEWLLARAYDRARATGDERAARALADLYVEHLRAAVRHARTVARERFGRETAQVLLLHANALAAEHGGQALDSLVADGAVPVPLEEALADPAFALEDGYVGPRGLSWLYRVAPARPELAAWDEAAEAEVRARIEAIAAGR